MKVKDSQKAVHFWKFLNRHYLLNFFTAFSTKLEFLNQELKVQKSRKEINEISDLFNETSEVSLIKDFNLSNGSLNMTIKNESNEDSFVACSQAQQSPVKRRIKRKKIKCSTPKKSTEMKQQILGPMTIKNVVSTF